MKVRRVVLILEVETAAPLSVLRKAKNYDLVVRDTKLDPWGVAMNQAQANVIAAKKDTKLRRR